jgi:hypothetical protein
MVTMQEDRVLPLVSCASPASATSNGSNLRARRRARARGPPGSAMRSARFTFLNDAGLA